MKSSILKNTRIFLTNPPLNMAETPLKYHRPLVPLGLGYLGGVIENAVTGGAWEEHVRETALNKHQKKYRPSGVVGAQDNMFLSFYGRFNFDNLINRMEHFFLTSPQGEHFIGLSVLSDGMRTARLMLRELRRKFPRAILLAGGPHATFFPLDFHVDPVRRVQPLVDYVVRNDGEMVIQGILEGRLNTKNDLDINGHSLGIKKDGCDYSDPTYRIVDGGQYRGAEEVVAAHVLDDLPPPAYFLFEDVHGDLPYEPDKRYGLSAPAVNINSSRGCPHKCTFCTIPKLTHGYRTLSPSRIACLIGFLEHQYRVRSVFFREDNFMYGGGELSGDRWPDILQICDDLETRKTKIQFAIEARADNLLSASGVPGTSRLEILRRAGLSGIYMGIESGSEEMLRLYAKGTTLDKMKAAIHACHERGVSVVATACYSDPDLLTKADYPSIKLDNRAYLSRLIGRRQDILTATRRFMAEQNIPPEQREEYTLVGIPVSVTYEVLRKAMAVHSDLVEHYDPETRYIYPKGFDWWASHVYGPEHRVSAVAMCHSQQSA